MTTKTETTITCDYCDKEIVRGNFYINARAYGADFHIDCVNKMTGFEMIQKLGLDDIKRMLLTREGKLDWDSAEKACYLKSLR